jgi:hypothetical protein
MNRSTHHERKKSIEVDDMKGIIIDRQDETTSYDIEEKLKKTTIANGQVKGTSHGARSTITKYIRFNMLLGENQSLTRQNCQLQTLLQESTIFCQERESKLKVTLKSVDMFKEDLIGRKEGGTDADQELRKENAALEDKVKIFEKQNVDSQLCFKKHLKLNCELYISLWESAQCHFPVLFGDSTLVRMR